MKRLPSRPDSSTLKSFGYRKGTHRGWKCISSICDFLPELIDLACVRFEAAESKRVSEDIVRRKDFVLSNGQKLFACLNTSSKKFLNVLSPLSYAPFANRFYGSLLLKSRRIPIITPVALMRRGGGFQKLDSVIVFAPEDGFVEFDDFIASLEGRPDPKCREVFAAIGRVLGEIHNNGAVAGISTPSQIWVRYRKGETEIRLLTGAGFQANPVLPEKRENDDLAGANFFFHSAISPLDRLRLFDNYAKVRGWDGKRVRKTIDAVSDSVRTRALKEWKVYPSDLPKKTTLLNLIRALDRHSEHDS